MKTYIKPTTQIVYVETRYLMQSNSVTTVTGVDGVEKGEGDFEGGASDSRRRNLWDDDFADAEW